MGKGSLNNLYTFDEIAKIYNMDSSNLRKMVQFNKFTNKEIKKFGKTWIITEEAVRKHFGNNIDIYFKNLKLEELQKMRDRKIQMKLNKNQYCKKIKNDNNMQLNNNDEDEIIDDLNYIEVDPGAIINSFTF